MNQKGTALFQEPESMKKVQFKAQEIFIQEFDFKHLELL